MSREHSASHLHRVAHHPRHDPARYVLTPYRNTISIQLKGISVSILVSSPWSCKDRHRQCVVRRAREPLFPRPRFPPARPKHPKPETTQTFPLLDLLQHHTSNLPRRSSLLQLSTFRVWTRWQLSPKSNGPRHGLPTELPLPPHSPPPAPITYPARCHVPQLICTESRVAMMTTKTDNHDPVVARSPTALSNAFASKLVTRRHSACLKPERRVKRPLRLPQPRPKLTAPCSPMTAAMPLLSSCQADATQQSTPFTPLSMSRIRRCPALHMQPPFQHRKLRRTTQRIRHKPSQTLLATLQPLPRPPSLVPPIDAMASTSPSAQRVRVQPTISTSILTANSILSTARRVLILAANRVHYPYNRRLRTTKKPRHPATLQPVASPGGLFMSL